MVDVARRAGVSIATVSRVINGTGDVAAETEMHVRKAIAEMNYRPSATARGLASKRTNMIGFITSEIATPFFAPILRGIEAGAREAGLGLLINCTQGEPGKTEGYQRHLGPHNTDGLLVFAGTLDDHELAYLHDTGFPVVLLHQAPPNLLDIPYVTFENKAGTRKIIDHLIDVHGYHRIAFLRGPENQEDSAWREAGYREALEAHDIPFDPSLVGFGSFDKNIAQIPIEKWLQDGQTFDAVFSGDDEAASGVILVLQRHGIKVPEDVAVVGFDDVHLANYLMPSLTTVRAPIESAGREAVRQVIRIINGEEPQPLTLLPTELVVRHSCGCQEQGGET
jgi:LacI family transcriptional regulator